MNEEFNHIDGHDCIDDAIYTIFNEKKLDYYYIFLESWRFGYNDKKNLVGKKIMPNRGDRFKLLKKLYNTNIKLIDIKNEYDVYPLSSKFIDKFEIQTNKEEIYKELITSLSEGKHVILEFDSFYCPWDKLYNRIHGTHMCNIKNIKEDEIEIYDRWYSKKNKYF